MEPNDYLRKFLNQMLEWEHWYWKQKSAPEYKISKEYIDKIRAESRKRLESILKIHLK